jgi:hypothetical protein
MRSRCPHSTGHLDTGYGRSAVNRNSESSDQGAYLQGVYPTPPCGFGPSVGWFAWGDQQKTRISAAHDRQFDWQACKKGSGSWRPLRPNEARGPVRTTTTDRPEFTQRFYFRFTSE